MPFIRIWVHAIWATKNRQPLLTDAIRNRIFIHIFENAVSKGVFMDCVNGYEDHVHYLFSLNSNQTPSKVMQLLKGESAYWINMNNLAGGFFEWQDE